MLMLHEHAVDRKIRDMKFSAVLHGADPKELDGKEKEFETAKNKNNLLFGDPAEYEKMDEEEKKKLSERMRKKFFAFAGVKKDG
jgi:hypothetical protein